MWVKVATALAIAAALTVLFFNARHYYPFIIDDAFISLRYAQRLIDGHGLSWTAGQPVEGYSNLLWVLLCAALGVARMDLVLATRVLGALGMVAVLAAIVWAVRPRRWAEVASVAIAMIGFAAAGPVGVWTVGGLEQPLVAGLIAWAVVTCAPVFSDEEISRRDMVLPSTLLALVALARADGPVLVAAVCAGVVILHRFRWRGWQRGLLLAALPLAAFLGQCLFRVVYYDSIVPNTALVKVAFTMERLKGGWDYVVAAAESSALLLIMGAVATIISVWVRGPRWRLACLAWIVAIAWTAYLVFIGGDIFPGYRHWVPVLALVAVAVAASLSDLPVRWSRAGWLGVAFAVVAVALFARSQPDDPKNHRATTWRWEYNAEVVGRLLGSAFGDHQPQPLLAVNVAGAVCFYSGLPSVDMLGLNDWYLARHPPKDFGTGMIGHELGDGAYVMRREPDLILFCGPTGRGKPCNRHGKEMVAMPAFERRYQFVYFRGEVPFGKTAGIWVHRFGRIGIETSPEAVTIPGYLLKADRRARAMLDDRGRIGLRIPARTSAHTSIPLAAGTWRLEIDSDTPEMLSVTVTDDSGRTYAGSTLEAFSLARDTEHLRVAVRASRTAHVHKLTFIRMADAVPIDGTGTRDGEIADDAGGAGDQRDQSEGH